MKDVFISYHTESAKSLVEEIARRIESRGLSCWYAPRDCENMWAEAIVQAIDTAAVFLVLLNSQSVHSENVKNEIHLAHENYCHHKTRIVAFQIEEQCLSAPSIRYYLGRTHVLNGTTPPLEDRITELVNRILYIRTQEPTAEDSCSEQLLESATVTPVANFVGRTREMQTLEQLLAKYKKVFVSGMGGLGKSELVKQFVCDHRTQFQTVLWGTYKDSLQSLLADDDFLKIRNFCREPADESDESYCRRKLEFLAKHGTFETLLVIDNFDCESDPLLEQVLRLPVLTIFTTRQFQYDSNNCYLQLEPMDNTEDLLCLFKKGYPMNLSPEDTQTVIRLIDVLGRHTLTVKLVANYMRQRRIKPAKMLELAQDPTHFGSRSVAEGISSIFTLSELSTQQQRILVNLALVPPEGMDTAQFAEALGIDDYDDINDLIGGNWLLYDSARDYISLHPVISKLILERPGYSDEACRQYVDAMIQLAIGAKYIEQDQRSDALKRAQWLLRCIPRDAQLYVPLCLACGQLFHAFAQHYKTIEHLTPVAQGDYDLYARIEAATDVADAYRCMHRYEDLLVKALEAEELCRLLPANDPRGNCLKAELDGRFGWYYCNSGDYETALARFENQREAVLTYEPDNTERVGWAHFNVAIARIGLGHRDQAIDTLQKAQACFRQIGMDFAIASVRRQIGILHLEMGQPQQALDCFRDSLKLFTQLVGLDHNDVACTRHQLAKACLALGDEAEARHQEALARSYCTTFGYENIINDWLFN